MVGRRRRGMWRQGSVRLEAGRRVSNGHDRYLQRTPPTNPFEQRTF